MMDIYDDFDPQQYDYESEQEDDIVYLEGPVEGEDPFLPYLAKDAELSQTQASQPTQENQQQQPSLLPRRRERQRRREEQMMHQEEESSDSEHSNHDDERDQDAFASLQSLLEKQSQQEKEKKAALNQDESVANDAKDETQEETIVQENESSTIVDQEPDHEVPLQDVNDNVIPETQSQFPLAEDWEPSQEANLTQETTRAIPMVSQHYTAGQYTNMSMDGPSISSGLIKELRRAQQKKDVASKPFAMNPPRAVDSNLLSELEKNRKRAALEKKTTRPAKKQAAGGGGGSFNKSHRPHFHRNRPQTQTTRVAKDTKSIVGSRPQHWGAARMPKHASAAKRPRKLAASPKSSHLASVVPQKPRSRLSLSQPSKSSLVKQNGQRRSLDERISFAPHFFHTKKSAALQQQDDDIESSQRPSAPAYQTPRILQRFNQNANNAAYSAGSSSGSDPKRKRKQQSGKKLKAGPLMKRLKALRSAVNGDTIRFQSGMYPFAQSANRRFDLSDPRNRASSYMDVSIVCEPVPWDEHERITALGFVHKSAKVTTKASTSDCVGSLVDSGRFAWISFTYDTAREQNVRKGSKLRIYNTVAIPSSSSVQVQGFGIENDETVERRCAHTVLCTQLCEALSALPDVVATSNT